MGFATIANGKFTGTVYTEMNKSIQDYHTDNGLQYVEIMGYVLADNATPTVLQIQGASDLAKWAAYDDYYAALTVTTDAMHQFAVNKEALASIATRRDSMLDSDSILWVESWGPFQTTRIELQEVIVKANTFTQAKITELFGGV